MFSSSHWEKKRYLLCIILISKLTRGNSVLYLKMYPTLSSEKLINIVTPLKF